MARIRPALEGIGDGSWERIKWTLLLLLELVLDEHWQVRTELQCRYVDLGGYSCAQ